MTREQAGSVVGVLLLHYPHQRLDEAQQRVYLDTLAALPFAPVDAAVRRLVLTSEFVPSRPAIIHEAGFDRSAALLGQVAEAVRTGQELVRDLASPTEWSIGTAVRPLPAGSEEPAALPPPGEPVDPERLAEQREGFRSLLRSLRASASERRPW